MTSFAEIEKNPLEKTHLVLVNNESGQVCLMLSAAEANELLNRVLSSKDEDSDTMTEVIMKLADAIRKADPLERYPAARVA